MVDLMKHHGTVSAKLRATNSAQAFLGTVIYAPKNKGTRVDFSESGKYIWVDATAADSSLPAGSTG
jgi:hypothetical protein